MRLATFNLYQFAEPPIHWYLVRPDTTFQPADWERKCAWLRQEIADLDADVIGLQEVFSPVQLETLMREAGYPHFVTVDTPRRDPEIAHLYTAPVVALASRFPVLEAEAVPVPPSVIADLDLPADFRISRAPIRAVVDVPDLGHLVVYVAHLKSNRSLVPFPSFSEETPLARQAGDTLAALARGRVGAYAKRMAEAVCLQHRVVEDLIADSQRPLAVVGDLNDRPDSWVIETLTLRAERPAVGDADTLASLKLYDSYRLHSDPHGGPRPLTHNGLGWTSTLDYVLVSNGLNPAAPDARGHIVGYHVRNGHISGDPMDDLLRSDHAVVAVDIVVRR